MTGWGAIGCLLEWASLPNLESGILLVMIRGFGNGYKGAQLALEMTLVVGSTSVSLVQGLTPVAWGRTQQFLLIPKT